MLCLEESIDFENKTNYMSLNRIINIPFTDNILYLKTHSIIKCYYQIQKNQNINFPRNLVFW